MYQWGNFSSFPITETQNKVTGNIQSWGEFHRKCVPIGRCSRSSYSGDNSTIWDFPLTFFQQQTEDLVLDRVDLVFVFLMCACPLGSFPLTSCPNNALKYRALPGQEVTIHFTKKQTIFMFPLGVHSHYPDWLWCGKGDVMHCCNTLHLLFFFFTLLKHHQITSFNFICIIAQCGTQRCVDIWHSVLSCVKNACCSRHFWGKQGI